MGLIAQNFTQLGQSANFFYPFTWRHVSGLMRLFEGFNRENASHFVHFSENKRQRPRKQFHKRW
jgi:hypothetical protein